VAFMQSKNINGSNFEAEFPKKARFALTVYDSEFADIQNKGIKSELINLYKEILGFDCRKLTASQSDESVAATDNEGEEHKAATLDGETFEKHFQRNKGQQFVERIMKHTAIGNRQHMEQLYQYVATFYQRIPDRNSMQFQCLLYLFVVKAFGLEMKVLQSDEVELDGRLFVNDSKWNADSFVAYLSSNVCKIRSPDIAMAIYDSIMKLHFSLEGIRKTQQCQHKNELWYMMRSCVIPRFNQQQGSKAKLDLDQLLEFIMRKENIDGAYFCHANRKTVNTDLQHVFGKNLKMKQGAIRKLCTDIDRFIVH